MEDQTMSAKMMPKHEREMMEHTIKSLKVDPLREDLVRTMCTALFVTGLHESIKLIGALIDKNMTKEDLESMLGFKIGDKNA